MKRAVFRPLFFGTPEGIRIPDLPLRRRTLYPAELPGHALHYCNGNLFACQQKRRDFFAGTAYTVRKALWKGGLPMTESKEKDVDLDDWLFAGEEYHPSER